MSDAAELTPHRVLTLPQSAGGPTSIRAQALVFNDPRSAELLEHVERIARSEASVLVIGPTGTGKELIARHVHDRSGRKGPFLAVNCGAFSESLIDAELFGHEAGAFTGASQARAGWFEAAHAGTLFLDEIGDLPLALQVKLLRVLQERQVVRLGSRRAVAIDVRLIAATNIDLRQAVQASHFRADLYYRLSVAPIELPALRERPGDILPLAHHFIGVYAPRLGVTQVSLSEPAEAALLDYVWPGNIRELENIIHFALIVCRHGVIRVGDLKLVTAVSAPTAVCDRETNDLQSLGRAPAAALALGGDGIALGRAVPQRVLLALQGLIEQGEPRVYARVEEALVRVAFAHAGENQVHAARVLGVTRNTLRTLLKRHGLLADAPAGPQRPAAAGVGALAH